MCNHFAGVTLQATVENKGLSLKSMILRAANAKKIMLNLIFCSRKCIKWLTSGVVTERRQISANPGLKFCFVFIFYFPMYCLE